MNIFKLGLEFKFEKHTHEDIIDSLKAVYKSRMRSKPNDDFFQKKWDELKHVTLKSLFDKEDIIGYSTLNKTTYYIANNEENNDINCTILYIVVLTEINDESLVINNVIDDIRKKLKHRHINVDLGTEMDMVMYFFDNRKNDIVTHQYVIKYEKENLLKLNKREIVLMIIMGILAVGLWIYKWDIILPGVKESIIASAIFVIISNLLNNYNFSKKFVLKGLPELYDLNYYFHDEKFEEFIDRLSRDDNEPDIPHIPNNIMVEPDIPHIPSDVMEIHEPVLKREEVKSRN